MPTNSPTAARLSPTGTLRIILAPLRGFTDAVYRTVYARHFPGVDLAVAPFVVAAGGRASLKSLADLRPEANLSMPVIPQVLGNDAARFIDLTERLADLGYRSVNWNLGCPFPMVARKRRGSGLLPYPARIATFLAELSPRLPLDLSIKTRLGYENPEELFALLPIFHRHGLEALVVHPRTGIQLYDGTVDLERFAVCLAASRQPVVYNGDIVTQADFQRLSNRFPSMTQWMLGRGVLVDPLLPARIKGLPLPTDPAGALHRFYEDITEAYAQRLSGPGHLLDRMKGFWRYASQGFEEGERVWRQIRRTKDMTRYRRLAAAVFADCPLKSPPSQTI
ncbi:MAG: tRNA-dihydrouridine synthase family protein [Desulfobacteraceae bacterium]|jgi:tRNA-dihydrouridine synthase|nr:tRNA-dihydrouridine synthase family protein [Desulfobacteraceae bacterium]